ncbi:50S ribosomal protein L33 [Spatholobus suberectus]|nr:50S ribosomal protein L33 [Spatholobus suberectus]
MATATGHVCSGLAVSGPSLSHPTVFSRKVTCQRTCFAAQHVLPLSVWPKEKLQVPARKSLLVDLDNKNKIIRLVSGAGTGFFYAKKKSNKMDKLELKKYDPKPQDQVVNIIIHAASISLHPLQTPRICSGSENLTK